MSPAQSDGIRGAVIRILAEHGHGEPDPSESLFLSGKLDSVAAMEVLMLLEESYGIDLADSDFDITQIDTLAMLEGLAGRHRRPAAPTAGGFAGLVAWGAMLLATILDPESPSGRVVPVLMEVA